MLIVHGLLSKADREKSSFPLVFFSSFCPAGGFSPRMLSDSSCLITSFVTPRLHDEGIWQLCGVTGLPVPMLMGEKLMGVFSLLVLHSSPVLLEWGPATWTTPKNLLTSNSKNPITYLGEKTLKSLCLQCSSGPSKSYSASLFALYI